MGSKGFLGLIIGPIIMIVVLVVAAIFAWWFSNTYPLVCMFAGPLLDMIGLGGFCFWIQFGIIILIAVILASKFK